MGDRDHRRALNSGRCCSLCYKLCVSDNINRVSYKIKSNNPLTVIVSQGFVSRKQVQQTLTFLIRAGLSLASSTEDLNWLSRIWVRSAHEATKPQDSDSGWRMNKKERCYRKWQGMSKWAALKNTNNFFFQNENSLFLEKARNKIQELVIRVLQRKKKGLRFRFMFLFLDGSNVWFSN